jgi:hypothetical protein
VNASWRTELRIGAILAVVVAIVFWGPWRAKPVIISAPTSTAQTKAPNDVEVAKLALQTVAVLSSGRAVQAPAYQMPAITVLRDAAPGPLRNASDAQIGAALSALQAKYDALYRVQSTLVAPSPSPTIEPPKAVPPEAAAWHHADVVAAVEEGISKSHIETHVVVDQVERPPSRIGSLVSADGASGISLTIRRNGQLDLDVGAVSKAGRVSPALAATYRIPHTSLGIGPILTLERGKPRIGIAGDIKF